ncbi:AAA family ATPase [Succinimonas sp.]|uniref:AAA family ATPase n=1 Tax=Succinimonas sp. TaxID=1936151 RepID=UPI00386A64B8
MNQWRGTVSLRYGQLSKVVIKGYKSLKKCELPLKSINVLIGCNGSGKSNFLSAFPLLQDVLQQKLRIFAGRSGINSLFYNGITETDYLSFEFVFDKNSYGYELIPADDRQLIFKNEFFCRYDEDQRYESSIASGHHESQWENGAGDKAAERVIPILKNQFWRVYHFQDTGRAAKVKQEHNIENNKRLMSDAANLAAFLYRLRRSYEKKYHEIIETIRLVVPFFDDFALEPNELNEELIILKWRRKGCEDIFHAAQLSDGALRFICLATLLLQPPELQPATIIIDEPELGLHPYAITLLADMIKQVAAAKQVIISTESPDLLDEFAADDVVVAGIAADKDGNGSSVLRRLDEKELRVWLEDYSLGDLWRKNILGGGLSRMPPEA